MTGVNSTADGQQIFALWHSGRHFQNMAIGYFPSNMLARMQPLQNECIQKLKISLSAKSIDDYHKPWNCKTIPYKSTTLHGSKMCGSICRILKFEDISRKPDFISATSDSTFSRLQTRLKGVKKNSKLWRSRNINSKSGRNTKTKWDVQRRRIYRDGWQYRNRRIPWTNAARHKKIKNKMK